jgi:hypothetical protein
MNGSWFSIDGWFYKAIDVYAIVRGGGDGITTFGERVKRAWKNISEIKSKKDEK